MRILRKLLRRLRRGNPAVAPSRRITPRLETLEDRITPAVTAEEQLFVYLLNLARHDPAAYAAQNQLSVSLSNVTPRQPLAINNDLFDSTEFHAQDMADRNYFNHVTPSGVYPNKMVRDQGYPLPSSFPNNENWVESIAAGNSYDLAGEVLNLLLEDIGLNPPGHRIHLLGMNGFAGYNEIGVGHAFDSSALYGHYWSIHTAYRSTPAKFLTGVAFHDTNGNHRYDLNEGLGGVTIQVGGLTTTTNAAGGWSIKVTGSGAMSVQASGGGFSGVATSTVSMGSQNIEVDFISGQSSGFVNFALPPAPPTPPVLDTSGNPSLPSIAEDTKVSASKTIAKLVGAAISNFNGSAKKGVAIVAASGGGVWQFSINKGKTYQALGTVSTVAARLLRGVDRIRFKPSANYNGTATLTVHAWDRSVGVKGGFYSIHGSSAFSTAQETISIIVTPVNDAPVLINSGSPILPAAVTSAYGATVASIIGSLISDVDGAVQGIAVVGVGGSANGQWQYYDTWLSQWVSLETASASQARLLRVIDLVRFVPDPGFSGTISLSFRAWDRSTGLTFETADLSKAKALGGKKAFSQALETASRVI